MPPEAAAAVLFAACYFAGAVPFGYLVARARGVNLFAAGSGNIGATNVGRVLGWKLGVLVFAFDFAKGAAPVALIGPVADALFPGAKAALGLPGVLPTGAAVFAFLGHLFPIYLGFRGGKGVATGAGAAAVLVPGPAAAAVAAWAVVTLGSRAVSAGSLAAGAVIVTVRLLVAPLDKEHAAATAYCVLSAVVVVVKHRANIRRLRAGTENLIGGGPMRDTLVKMLHVAAVGIWVGGAGFFNATAPGVFATFTKVVEGGPSDRTAGVKIVPDGTPDAARKNLASALAGSAVGPIFPKYFAMQGVCAFVSLVTALAWRRAEPASRVHRLRIFVLALASAGVAAGWPISTVVTEYRLARFSAEPAIAAAAVDAFGVWHAISLGLSGLTILFAFAGLLLAARLPPTPPAGA